MVAEPRLDGIYYRYVPAVLKFLDSANLHECIKTALALYVRSNVGTCTTFTYVSLRRVIESLCPAIKSRWGSVWIYVKFFLHFLAWRLGLTVHERLRGPKKKITVCGRLLTSDLISNMYSEYISWLRGLILRTCGASKPTGSSIMLKIPEELHGLLSELSKRVGIAVTLLIRLLIAVAVADVLNRTVYLEDRKVRELLSRLENVEGVPKLSEDAVLKILEDRVSAKCQVLNVVLSREVSEDVDYLSRGDKTKKSVATCLLLYALAKFGFVETSSRERLLEVIRSKICK